MNNEKQARLDALYDSIEVGVFPYLESRTTQLVRGHGDPDADIVIIGEAPGQDEDKQGIPFVGGAGQLYDSFLADSGLSRQDVFTTNAVKRNPTKVSDKGRKSNRAPTPQEQAVYHPHLHEELGILGAYAIITLGVVPAKQLIEFKRLGDVKGVPHWVDIAGKKTLLLPQYHPSYAIRDPNKEPLLRADFKEAIELIKHHKNNP